MVSLSYLHQLPHHLVQQLAPLGHRALISLLGHQYSTGNLYSRLVLEHGADVIDHRPADQCQVVEVCLAFQ